MDYKTILTNYIASVDATAGAIVYQPCDCLIEVCDSQTKKDELLQLVERSDIQIFDSSFGGDAYQDLVEWSQESDLLLTSSENVLFCIPKMVA